MVDLISKSPCAGLLPLSHGGVTLSEVDPGHISALMPFRGQESALSAAMQAAHGLAFPEAGRVSMAGTVHCVWTGRGQAFLMGVAPDAALAAHGAVTDQSDAWAVVLLEGPASVDVLARLVPLDLRMGAFPVGYTARSLLQHMSVSVTRVGGTEFQVMAFRSMARTLVHEIGTAMALVAARASR